MVDYLENLKRINERRVHRKICPDCKGTKTYKGLFETGPCETCQPNPCKTVSPPSICGQRHVKSYVAWNGKFDTITHTCGLPFGHLGEHRDIDSDLEWET